jgi:glycosyltransferase involved in cell wall biosynthesis
MEYLVSGKPTAGYLLEGIGEEYHPYINLLQGRDAKSLADDLRKLMDEDYTRLREKALQAREFLLREKTSRRQAEKLIEFLKTL